MTLLRKLRSLALVTVALCAGSATVSAENTTSNVRATKHNLSASTAARPNANTVRAEDGGTDQICVFCHTPHAANATARTPLWNRNLGGVKQDGSTYGYQLYESSSMDAPVTGAALAQPGAGSKMCLSCHDGMISIGAVANRPGPGGAGTITMRGTATGGFMPAGSGGNTRNLGTDLRNDHPISFTFDADLAKRDGEMRAPPSAAANGKVLVDSRGQVDSSGNAVKPLLPLDHDGHVQCTTCHDPHLVGDRIKFLRLNRFQAEGTVPGSGFNSATDQICFGCHNKNKDYLGGNYAAWSNSIHAVATHTYKDTPASDRDFPPSLSVARAACLNCHDTHTTPGARRLLREGADGSGAPALENTCYQCHGASDDSVINNGTFGESTGVPNIKGEFAKKIRMPIVSGDQRANAEVHEIGGNFNDIGFVDCGVTANKCGADFIESQTKLGLNALSNRHVECTDCHNPHRVIKNSLFDGSGESNRRTHRAGSQGGAKPLEGNLASGALRGTWGIEVNYPTTSAGLGVWPRDPGSYTVKRGDPGSAPSKAKDAKYLTREYQLCFKCHSGYSLNETTPALGGHTGGTKTTDLSARAVNARMVNYTNIAAEFSVNAVNYGTSLSSLTNTDQCEAGNDTACTPNGSLPGDAGTTATAGKINHRSWHPVHFPTGRTGAERRNAAASGGDENFRAPFKSDLGIQTMHCSDCHGPEGSWTQNTGPDFTKVQGPHGSTNNFLLRGAWDPTSNTPGSPGLCGNCHVGSVSNTASGFGGTSDARHNIDYHNKRCGRCHIAVPHGWKNKAFLVNLNCVGKEGGAATDCVSNRTGDTGTLDAAPYYVGAALRIRTWQRSRNWSADSCGTLGSNAGTDYGTSWMSSTC